MGLLRVLLVEDSEDDAALTLRQLKKGGYEPSHKRVDTPDTMRAALEARDWDIILSDFSMPEFSGPAALALLRSTEIDLPFIVISGAMGEQTAVDLMKAGAHDYIMKDNLVRLIPAIERELREAEVRRARRRAEADLRLSAKVFESSVEGVMITDHEAHILRVNKAFTEITGYTEAEVIGQKPNILASGRHGADFYRGMWQSITDHGYWQGEIWNRRKSGEVFPEWLTISTVNDDGGQVTHLIGGFTDLSQQKQAEDRIQHLMYYDALTDLPNRTLYQDRCKRAMLRARRVGKRVAYLHLDVDRFGTINDTLGHQAGDSLLQQVGQRLSGSVRQQDLVARFVGDEFGITMVDLDHETDVSGMVQLLIGAFAEPFRVKEQEIFLVPSVGVSLFPGDATEYNELARFADTALHSAKRDGGASFQFYRKSMHADASDRLTMESALRRALERNEFQLYYQPQLSLATGKIIGVEALIRWKAKEGEMVLPGKFIPVLEETGLIVPVGAWIMRQACGDHADWAKRGYGQIPIAVNLSARQFRDENLVDMIRKILQESGTDPRMIELEITESCVMENPEVALNILKECHGMGMRIAIDDFGTGYSSLSYLKKFPLDVLKIDQSFVADVIKSEDDAAIIDTIIAMGHRLNLSVIAEGVETEEQADFLREHGCDNAQGFFYDRPMPSDQLISRFDSVS
ncbi:MAG: EAL domain-containing protein [Ectothiorhodospiraceae bacterium]|nr:EAL domain-containing protein [Ectothiorhodospiraceae bacterium]